MANRFDMDESRRKALERKRRGQDAASVDVITGEVEEWRRVSQLVVDNEKTHAKTGQLTNTKAKGTIEYTIIRKPSPEVLEKIKAFASHIKLAEMNDWDGGKKQKSAEEIKMETAIFNLLKEGIPIVLGELSPEFVRDAMEKLGIDVGIDIAEIDAWLRDDARSELRAELEKKIKELFPREKRDETFYVDGKRREFFLTENFSECVDIGALEDLCSGIYKDITGKGRDYYVKRKDELIKNSKIDSPVDREGRAIAKGDIDLFYKLLEESVCSLEKGVKVFSYNMESKVGDYVGKYSRDINRRRLLERAPETGAELVKVAQKLGERYENAVKQLIGFENEKVKDRASIALKSIPALVSPDDIVLSNKFTSAKPFFSHVLENTPSDEDRAVYARVLKNFDGDDSELTRAIVGVAEYHLVSLLSCRMDCEKIAVDAVDGYNVFSVATPLKQLGSILSDIAFHAALEGVVDGNGNSILLCSVETGRLELDAVINSEIFDEHLTRRNGSGTPLVHMFLEKGYFNNDSTTDALVAYVVRNPDVLSMECSKGHSLAAALDMKHCGNIFLDKIADIVREKPELLEQRSRTGTTLQDALRKNFGESYENGFTAKKSSSGVYFGLQKDVYVLRKSDYERVGKTAKAHGLSMEDALSEIGHAAKSLFERVGNMFTSVACMWTEYAKRRNEKIVARIVDKYTQQGEKEDVFEHTSSSSRELTDLSEKMRNIGESAFTQTPTEEELERQRENMENAAKKEKFERNFNDRSR